MKRMIVAGLALAALTMPGLAQAKVTRGELHRDAREVRQERHDLHKELRQHDLRGARDERRELRDAKHDLRHDKRAFKRQHHRGR